MDTKTKLIVASTVIIVSFAAGRWSAPEKVKIETKIVETIKNTKDQNKKINKKIKIIKKETVKANGDKTVTTVLTDDSKDSVEIKTTKTKNETDTTSKESVRTDGKVTISMLGGYDASRNKTTYGFSISKPVLGPLTIGIFGFIDKIFGASVGLSF